MKDRQPTKVLTNGAIRYGIYREDGTLDHYEYMKREDAPTVEGTPLNKANLLSDATAAKLWPNASARPEDPTVSQALAELRKGTTKVGDILMTARAKPSDAWLLCNGQSITKSSFPKLFGLLRAAASPAAWTDKTVTGIDKDTDGVCYVNSKWFAFASDLASYHRVHMYVSTDVTAWEHHTYVISEPFGGERAAMYYDAENDMYYIAVKHSTSSVTTLALSSDFQTLTQIGEIDLPAGTSYTRTVGNLRLYKRNNGQLCCEIWSTSGTDLFSTEAFLYVLNSSTQSWSNTNFDTDIAAIDYDSALDRFYYVKSKNLYFTEDLSASGEKTLVGTFSDMVTNFDDHFAAFINLSTNTVIVVFNKRSENWSMKYLYSTDRGVTWHEGAEALAGLSSSDGIPTVAISSGFQYVNGLLIFTIEASPSYICSVSDPADKVDKTSGKFTGALNTDWLAIMPPTTKNVSMCNYADAARPVPTIIPDSRSHAYIKALEE